MMFSSLKVIRHKESVNRAGGEVGKGGKKKGTKTYMFIRRIPIAYTVGQLCPKMEVPAPKSKKAQSYVSKRLHVFICNTFKSEKIKYEQKYNANPKTAPTYWGLTKEKCTNAFGTAPENLKELLPPISAAIVRNGLKKVASFKHQVARSTEGMWTWNEGEEMPDEKEIQDTVEPETICAYESMQAALLRLERMGYGIEAQDTAYNQDADNHHDEADVTAQDEVRMAPWRVTSDFIAHIDGKCLMYVTGAADPTGCNEGFAYLRKPNKPANSTDSRENKLKPQESSTLGRRNTGYAKSKDAEGQAADLRKLTVKQMRTMLQQTYGMKQVDIQGLQRWRLVALVREHCTTAAGSEGNHRFARGQRSTIAEYQEQFRRDLQSRFDVQNANLQLEDKSTDESDSEDEAQAPAIVGDMNESLKPGSRTSSLVGGGPARKKSGTASVTSAGMDDTSTVVSGAQTGVSKSSKKITINRSYKDENGKIFTRQQVVRDPEVIETYMRYHRKRESSGKNKQKTDRFKREQKKKLKRELDLLKKQAAKETGSGRCEIRKPLRTRESARGHLTRCLPPSKAGLEQPTGDLSRVQLAAPLFLLFFFC